jgi:3-(3-hydroxy-phenyl)propionate hydroxylase
MWPGLDGKPFITGPTGPTSYTGHAVANFFHQPLLEQALRDGLRRCKHVDRPVRGR